MSGAARLGDKAQINLDAHGCPACPHPGIGPAIAGSPDVNVNKRPQIRLDDPGMHMACCGTNQWTAMQGSISVFINGKPAVRMGDKTRHCGGIGAMVEGSPNVIIGGPPGTSSSGGSGGGGGGGGAAGGGGSGGGASAHGSGGGGGGAGGGGAGGGGGSTGGATSSRAGGASRAGATTGAGGGGTSQPRPPDDHVFVVSAELQSPGGVALAFEQVVLLKHGTDERIAGPFTTDAKGHFATVVPDNAAYDIQLLDDGTEHHQVGPPDAEVATHLHCQFLVGGVPAVGELVTVSGQGISTAATLGTDGELDLVVAPGAYELRVRKQTFHAHSLNTADIQRGGGGHYRFEIAGEHDPDELERARADRYSPAQRDEEMA
jgi:uncharacterized Zn-binding protein involved in type VI secretion